MPFGVSAAKAHAVDTKAASARIVGAVGPTNKCSRTTSAGTRTRPIGWARTAKKGDTLTVSNPSAAADVTVNDAPYQHTNSHDKNCPANECRIYACDIG
jgi:hypothetical protein